MTVTDQTAPALTDEEQTVLRQLIESQQSSQQPDPHGSALTELRTSALETEARFQAILKAKNTAAARRRRTLYLMWRELPDVRMVAAMLPGTVTMHTVVAAVAECASRQDFNRITGGMSTD